MPVAEWERRPYRVLVTRLSTYRDTAVSTSHLLVHAVLAGLDGVYPDLAWLPPPRDGELMAADGVPWLLGTQTKRGVRDFDCLGVSLSVPQEQINLAAMLLRSGIPVDRRDRLADDTAPLVIAGGASVGAAAALYGADSGVDGIFVGGDPGAIAALFGRCRDGRARGLGKREVLDTLRDIDGFLLPGEASPPPRALAPREAAAPGEAVGSAPAPAWAMPVSYDPARTGIVTVPVTEGCRWKCSFCYESWLHPRYRSLPGAEIDARARELKAWAGAHRAELFSFNFDMHEDIRGIIERLSTGFDRLGLKSQRFDRLADDPGLLELMHAVGKTSLTCGMEGISDRLRAYLNKRLDQEKLRRALAAIAAAPLRQVKVFLIATGHERQDDLAEFAALLDWFGGELAAQGRRPRVVFSITPLVHFPSTPLGFEPPPPPERAARAVRRIARAIRDAGFQVRAAARDPEAVVTQALVSGRHPRAPAAAPGDAGAIWRALVATVSAHGFVYHDAIT
ncbi:radical SAM protein, partial [bacterium]|nr:radical SAM protein [bacterium]